MENLEYTEIDASTEKILFAEDIVSFVMSKTTWPEHRPSRVERFRPFVKSAFTPVIGLAVRYLEKIHDREMRQLFNAVKANYQLTSEGFEHYAENFSVVCFRQGFETNIFLNFCVYLTTVAFYYYNNGVKKAPFSASFAIAKCMKHDNDGYVWELLYKTALKYAKMDELIDAMTPESENDE